MYGNAGGTATHCHTLQHTATHCNTNIKRGVCHLWMRRVQQMTRRMSFRWMCHVAREFVAECNTRQGNTLQHTATHCNTLQHTREKRHVSLADASWMRRVQHMTRRMSFRWMRHVAYECVWMRFWVQYMTKHRCHLDACLIRSKVWVTYEDVASRVSKLYLYYYICE